jgi:Pentapeptide repeats (9 copies)
MVQARPKWEGAASALFHLAHRLAVETGKDAVERTGMLMKLLGVKSPITQLAVQGQIGGLDFGGLQFKDSTFKNVVFHNCSFDESTRFVECRFEGNLSFERCKTPGLLQLDDCFLSDEAQEAVDEQAGKTAKRVINSEVAKAALREILRKFIGPFGFSTIKESDKNSGPILKNPCREIAWEELFKRNILERHRISGIRASGINVADVPEVKHEVRNFLDNAALGVRLKKVVDEIVRRS